MKTVLMTAALLCALAFTSNAQITGACDVTSVTTEFVSSGPSAKYPGMCDVKVNISWEQASNNGNKFSYFHIWQAATYQAFNYTNPANPPKAADLSATLGTIVVKDPSSANPTIYSTYNPDESYTRVLPLPDYAPLVLRRVLVNNVYRFTIENVVLPGVACNPNGIYKFMAEVWSSQQSQGKNVHCVGKGNPFSVNEIVNKSLVNCSASAVQVQLLSSAALSTGTVKLFADLSAYGKFEPSVDVLLASQTFVTGAAVAVSGTWAYKFTSNIAVPGAYRQSNLYVEVVTEGGKASQIFLVNNGCAPLPENLASFTASRTNSSVKLQWQTVNEQNSKGFAVQRKTSGGWEQVAFVPSNSGGNSSTRVSYDYSETNNFKGISQYRVAEVTTGDKYRLSEIRAVRGQDQSGKLSLYPNPSIDGRVNLVFNNNTSRDITVNDATGRVVRQFKGTTSANVILDNLKAGFYSVHIQDRATNEVLTEKIIVSK